MVIDLDQIAANADQIIMPIMQPIRLVERLELLAMQPRREQRPLDVGFWNPLRSQIEMF